MRSAGHKTPKEGVRAREHWRELVHHLVTRRNYQIVIKEDVILLISPDGKSILTLPRELYDL
jgi:hypothetical protein